MSTHGMTLKMVCRGTGLGPSKVKMILARHQELQEPPYSAKAGGARVFFQPFVEWLAKYEGQETADKMKSHESHNGVTSVTRLPNGTQLEALRKIYGPVEAGKRLDFIIGYRNLFNPTYQQAELALPAAPRSERPSILRQSYPITSAHAVAIILGKEPAWVDARARQYDIKIDSFYLEDLYVLWCVANGHTIRSLHGPADRREAVIREHVGQMERVSV